MARQIKRLDEIIYLKSEWLENAAYIEISARKNTVDKNNIKTVIDLVETSVGKNIFDKIRLIQHQFIIEEQTLLSKRVITFQTRLKIPPTISQTKCKQCQAVNQSSIQTLVKHEFEANVHECRKHLWHPMPFQQRQN